MGQQASKFEDAPSKRKTVELEKRLRRCIQSLNNVNFIYHQQDRERIVQFEKLIKPSTSVVDEGRFPYYASRPRSKLPLPEMCILTMLSRLFQDWVSPALNRFQKIHNQLVALEAIIKHGLEAYKVEGDIAQGYRLVKKK